MSGFPWEEADKANTGAEEKIKQRARVIERKIVKKLCLLIWHLLFTNQNIST